MKIKDLPINERPYERLEKYGPEVLSDAELLAIIIKTGTKEKTAVQIAQEIFSYDYENNGVTFLRNYSLEQLSNIKGIGKVKAIQLKALGEISVRLSYKKPIAKKKITTPEDASLLVMVEMKDLKTETIRTILLDKQNQVLRVVTNCIGGLNSVAIEAKELFKEPIKSSAAKIIIVHNHPSGSITPSKNDIEFTRSMCEVGNLIGIEIIDHIIIGGENFCSLKRMKMF